MEDGEKDETTDLRRIVPHVIEGTARHAGHLDAVRELLDGRTGLGPRWPGWHSIGSAEAEGDR